MKFLKDNKYKIMIKVKFETKQDYINYCIENDIVSYHMPYGGRPHIDNSMECKEPIPGYKARTFIEIEPLSYPCIFVYTLDYDGDVEGTFIYPNDF